MCEREQPSQEKGLTRERQGVNRHVERIHVTRRRIAHDVVPGGMQSHGEQAGDGTGDESDSCRAVGGHGVVHG